MFYRIGFYSGVQFLFHIHYDQFPQQNLNLFFYFLIFCSFLSHIMILLFYGPSLHVTQLVHSSCSYSLGCFASIPSTRIFLINSSVQGFVEYLLAFSVFLFTFPRPCEYLRMPGIGYKHNCLHFLFSPCSCPSAAVRSFSSQMEGFIGTCFFSNSSSCSFVCHFFPQQTPPLHKSQCLLLVSLSSQSSSVGSQCV